MKNRLLKIIDIKAGGRQVDFADMMGWRPQYLGKLIHGSTGFGLQPVLAILAKFPDIDARWFLFGTGTIDGAAVDNRIRSRLYTSVASLLELEKYMPVMTQEELHRLELALSGKRRIDFKPEEIASLQWRLSGRSADLDARITDAVAKSDELCKSQNP